MTDRSREQFSPASEELSYFQQPGSFLFSHPAEVKDWCQSIPQGDIFPLTPPDTASDCAISDYQDMSAQPWSQAPPPEGPWTSGPNPELRSYVPLSGGSWQGRSFQQDLDTLNSSTWLDTPSSTVDLGLSPVLSHESQSSHTLHSFSEPDVPALPLSLDLSFAEASWNPNSRMPYSSLEVSVENPPGNYYMASPSQATYRASVEHQPLWSTPQAIVPDMPHMESRQHAEYMMLPLRGPSYPSTIPKRPLLPKTEGPAVPSQPVYGPQRMLRPQVPKPQPAQASLSSVSTVPVNPYGVPQQVSAQVQGPFGITPRSMSHSQPTAYAPGLANASSHHESGSQNRPAESSIYHPEHGTEDFSSFLHFDLEEQNTSPTTTRLESGYSSNLSLAPHVIIPETRTVTARPEHAVTSTYQTPVIAMSGLPSEQEEGRHRTHALYSEGPKADGLYHCPFTSDPSCQHRPTKLKCNYDKFIDSHIKPFRCKVESCAKQEFSSTACLLRHEREAHGMHGHGERPHLCYYPGCERGILGNGFPRRYNLFDHMKRVHDHKEDMNATNGSPLLSGESQGQTRAGGRKRKASGPTNDEPVANRQRSTPAQPQPNHGALHPTQGFPSYPGAYQQTMEAPQQPKKTQHRQRVIYSQWANQRELLARQMDFVQSPDDDASLQRLSQNIEELRRLSHEVRRG